MTASQASSHRSAVAAFGIAVILLGAEALCAVLLWCAFVGGALLLHLAVSVIAALLAWRRGVVLNAPTATLRMTTLLMPFLGPVAALAAVGILALQIVRREPDADAATWHEHLFPNLAADPITEQMDAISRRHTGAETAGEVESFYDVLQWGTLSEQEHVLSLISRSFRPEFAPVLRKALAGDDLGLRAQAAAGLSLLEARTSARLSELQTTLRQTPAGSAQEELSIVLARALSDAAYSGLYDEMRSAEMWRDVVSLLTPIFHARAGEPALGAILGRTLIQLGELDSAVSTLEIAVESGQQNEAAFAWLLEGLYRQRSFAHLAALIERRREQATPLVSRDGPLAPALRFWGVAA